jgi:hypothetical protein
MINLQELTIDQLNRLNEFYSSMTSSFSRNYLAINTELTIATDEIVIEKLNKEQRQYLSSLEASQNMLDHIQLEIQARAGNQ